MFNDEWLSRVFSGTGEKIKRLRGEGGREKKMELLESVFNV